MMQKLGACFRLHRFSIACAVTIWVAAAIPAYGQTAKDLEHPGLIFSRELADVPGKNLVVVALEYPPNPPEQSKPPRQFIGHRHPGSVYVYVVKGTMRLGIAGEPVQVVPAGGSFFEPVGALHTVSESASATEPASAIAVLIVPEGAPIVTPVEAPKQ
jgi:quercetin dioxygenase-like cupin family protein